MTAQFSLSFGQLGRVAQWGLDHPKLAETGLTPREVIHFQQAVQHQKMGATALRVFEGLKSLAHSDQRVDPDITHAVSQFDRILSVQHKIQFKRFAENADGFVTTNRPHLSERVLEADDDAGNRSLLVPLTDDPRSIVLPALTTQGGSKIFINGYDAKRNTLTVLIPTIDDVGNVHLIARVQQADSGEIVKTRQLGTQIFHDKETNIRYFAISDESKSPIFALKFNFGNPAESSLVRYPSYEAAGFDPIREKSTVLGFPGAGREHEHYFVDIFVSRSNKIELTIIENEKGEIEKVADFRLGEEYLPLETNYHGKPMYRITDDISIVLTRRLGNKGYYYKVDILHDFGSKKKIEKKHESAAAVELNADNTIWIQAVQNHVDRLKFRMTKFFHVKALLKELKDIQKSEGDLIAHEVIMALYYDEDTQMHMVQALRQSRGLPIPPDTRIVPLSADSMTALCEFLSQNSTQGKLSRSILETATEMSHVPVHLIQGLWLGLHHQTRAEILYHVRGADTPEFVVGGYPVHFYRRVIDEDYTGVLSTPKTRSDQRERILDMLNQDALSSSFKHYLGQQLGFAEDFDLLILDSGFLFLGDKKVHPLDVSDDGKSLRVIDGDGEVFLIPRERVEESAFKRSLELTEDNLKTKKQMAPVHADDPFRFVWLGPNRSADGGSFRSGTILLKDAATNLYRRAAPVEIAKSMNGLLELPREYLDADELLPIVERELVDLIETAEDFVATKGEPFELDLGALGHGLEDTDNRKLKMVPYYVEVDGAKMEFMIPSPDSNTAQVLANQGYYVATEEDLPKIVKYYLTVARLGFFPDRPNLYLLPGMISDGILGFYLFKDESMMISSRKAKKFEEWAARMFFNTIRHEMAHAIHRINPWVTSLIYRAMALDAVSMDYGNTSVNEYWSVLVQNFFDHPQNRYRFPNGYKLVYTLFKLRELGVRWDGPHHDLPGTNGNGSDRNIDGTQQALRILALGGDPFQIFRDKNPPSGGDDESSDNRVRAPGESGTSTEHDDKEKE